VSENPLTPIIVVAGPTGVGKTAVAAGLAKRLGAEVINADSRQFYAELPIGTAQPGPEVLSMAPHHFVGHLSAKTDFWQAGDFMRAGREVLARLATNGKPAVIAGGSGLYIKALLFGLDEVPEVAEGVRENIKTQLAANGLHWLQWQVLTKDPAYARQADMSNPQRLIRALELMETTGLPYSQLRKSGINKQTALPDNIQFLVLHLPREELYARINTRVDEMMAHGLLQEAEHMLPFAHMPALATVGYREMFSYLKGECSLPEAVALMKQNTRNYAKRQLTWLRNQVNARWLTPEEAIYYAF